MISISKSDMLDDELKSAIANEFSAPVHFFSSVAQQGLQELKDKLWTILQK
jgi:GTP-binding protein